MASLYMITIKIYCCGGWNRDHADVGNLTH